MGYANSRVLDRFERDVMPVPRVAEFLYDAIRDRPEKIVPVAVPDLASPLYSDDEKIKLRRPGFMRILFVPRNQPFSIIAQRFVSAQIGDGEEWWHHNTDELALNGLTRGFTVQCRVPENSRNPVIVDAFSHNYVLAGRVRSGFDNEELTPDSNSFKEAKMAVADRSKVGDIIGQKALVGWEDVGRIRVGRAVGFASIGDTCRVSDQIPAGQLDQANEVWGTNFGRDDFARYQEIEEARNRLKQQLGCTIQPVCNRLETFLVV